MNIHQIQVRYDATADRLLLLVRSTQAQLYGVWLTRRLLSHLYTPLRQALAQQGIAQAMPQALPVPEARAMLEQAVLQRPLPGANFQQPFEDAGTSHPLGRDPLLPGTAQLSPRPDGGLVLMVQEERGRRLELSLGTDVATALLRLVDAALQAAQWDLPAHAAALPAADAPAGLPSAPASGQLLN